ncbi:MAG TPA: LemA family protein [Bacteroidia bacterium]|nr:LemA family protein [Bacteroidia bacterium]
MKKWIVIGIILIVIAIVYQFFKSSFNNMVTYNESVKKEWANVEAAYQRRLDLIPNLVSTVKGAADFEKSTLTAVIEARAGAAQAAKEVHDQVDREGAKGLSPENIQKFQAAQNQLATSVGRMINIVVEQYPQLRATENFRELQSQLEGTENRITVARRDFNDKVIVYNTYIKRFPQNLLAGMYGFQESVYFEADKGAEKAPAVKF